MKPVIAAPAPTSTALHQPAVHGYGHRHWSKCCFDPTFRIQDGSVSLRFGFPCQSSMPSRGSIAACRATSRMVRRSVRTRTASSSVSLRSSLVRTHPGTAWRGPVQYPCGAQAQVRGECRHWPDRHCDGRLMTELRSWQCPRLRCLHRKDPPARVAISCRAASAAPSSRSALAAALCVQRDADPRSSEPSWRGPAERQRP